MASLTIHPVSRIKEELYVPGDKSISHRSVLLGGFAAGETKITNFLSSEDCLASLGAMQALGVEVEHTGENSYLIQGRGGKLLQSGEPIDCGNSGTTIRLLSGLVAGQPITTHLFGDASLSKRPMKRIVDPLTQMGASLHCEGKDFRPPLTIEGSQLKGIDYKLPIASAQLKSAILLAGLSAEGKTVVEEISDSRDHTERMLKHFHGSITKKDKRISVHGNYELHGEAVDVPGDFSSAAFWLVAASAMPMAQISLPNVGLNPTRTGLLNVLMRMGAQIKEIIQDNHFEPCGTLDIIEGCILKATEIGGEEIPNIIDEIPIIAVAAALADGVTIIKDAAELRVKESDRLHAVATNLKAFGVPVEEKPDGLIIEGGATIRAAQVNSFGDHRIAMAFSILGLFADGKSVIENTECIDTSYPTFTEHLNRVLKADPTGRFKGAFSFLSKKSDSEDENIKKDPEEESKTSSKREKSTMKPVIAIDGPAASGKSTVSRQIAEKLKYVYVDTGAMYRSFAWLALEKKIDPSDRSAVKALIQSSGFKIKVIDSKIQLEIDGQDPNPHIRTEAVNGCVSAISSIPELREFLVIEQRKLRNEHPLVMEGRDIGTVVFTDTPLKFYIDADPEVRLQRRKKEGLQDQLGSRDKQDQNRKVAPLTKAADATLIDATHLTAEQVVDKIMTQAQAK